ncbi:MAG: TonB-dependent receptor [Candidatus Omnitrophota bacterium]|nr:TonB-dependent receptor [Candidatus Omnitrophota bacterium]
MGITAVKKFFFAAITLILTSPFALSFIFAQEVKLEKIVVEKNNASSVIQNADYFTKEEIQSFPFSSCEEIVDYSSSVNLKKRSNFGIQQDVSIRGSIFEDANISLAGVKINDPQTGHFSLEIPLTSADLDGIEIRQNTQRINFTPKKPDAKGFLLKNSFGQYALWENLMSINFPLLEAKNRLSIEHKISKGSRRDTDFEIYNFSYHYLWETEASDTEFLFGLTKRDFGADSFYSSRFTQEEEHTEQKFFLGRLGLNADFFKLNNTVYLRRHRDKYILNRANPSFYTNYHTTYVYGLKQEFDFYNDLFAALNIEQEKIDSTNLSKHYRLRKGLSLGLKEKEFGKFIFGLSAGTDYYDKWEYLENGHLGAGYFLNDNLKLRFSFDHIWRAPSFTELYYSDPANAGNPNLGIQKSNNFETGFDFLPSKTLSFSPSFFFRNQSNTIDWVKNNSADRWKAKNVGSVNAYGLDFFSKYQFKNCVLDNISLGYTYLNLEKESPYSYSKYVFDYDRHKVVTNFGFNYKGFRTNLISNFSKPVDREKYVTFDVKAEKQIRNFTLALEGTNIFNESYEEMKDIDGSKRWYKLSVAYTF